MATRFQLKVQSTDFLAKTRQWEFTVIPANRTEAEEEIAQVMSMHDEVETWTIREWVSAEELPDGSPFTAGYAEKGSYAYFT